MNRRRSHMAGGRAGLLAALYLFTALMPVSVAAADPSQPAASETPVATLEPTTPSGPPVEPPAVEPSPTPGPTVEPSATGSPSPAPPPSPTESPPPAPPSPAETAAPAPSVGPSRTVGYIVTFSRGATTQQQTAAMSAGDTTLVSIAPALGLAFVELPAGSATAGAAALRARAGVERVELDRARAVDAVGADPRYDEQWSLRRIRWDEVHEAGLPTGDAVVAILDTGVDAYHPDLAGRLVAGHRFVDGHPAHRSPHGHGTWLTGIVAAAVDDAHGIAGIGGRRASAADHGARRRRHGPGQRRHRGASCGGRRRSLGHPARLLQPRLLGRAPGGHRLRVEQRCGMVAANGNDGITRRRIPPATAA